MKRALKLILAIPVIIVIVALSVANRDPVVFSFDPFGGDDPAFSMTVPLYWLLFAAALIGVAVGGVATCIGQSKWRRAARHDHAEMERLKRERERAAQSPTVLPLPMDRQPLA